MSYSLDAMNHKKGRRELKGKPSKFIFAKFKQKINDSDKFISYTGPSMNPTLKPGDRLLVLPYNDQNIRRGDVVIFLSPENCQKVTHRVISVSSQGIRTRGDNNNRVDSVVLEPNDILGRVVYAQRRNKFVSIHGGKIGQYYAIMIRAIHTIDSAISLLLRPIYYSLAKSGIFRRFANIQKKITVLSFERPTGTELQLLLGRHLMGRLLPGHEHWQIRRPFRLFVDEESLPGKEQHRLIPSESGVFRGDKTINKKNRNHFDLTDQIRETHKELTLCGEPRNALLSLSDEVLFYISSLLRNISLRPPEILWNQWSEVLTLFRSHWILPLLYRQISSLPPENHLPEEVMNKMRKSFLISRVRCFHMEKQLDEIINAFHNKKLQILVLKGPSLALSVYPDPALRPSSDLDLLVLSEQMSQARAILEELGYQNLGKRFEHSRDFYSEETFLHQKNARDNRAIELHWDLHAFSGISREVKVEELFDRAVKIKKAGLTFETLHPVDALIHRAINMAIWHNKDIRLIWIYDTALLAQRLEASKDWKVLLERSVNWRARLALEYSLKMAQVWVGFKLPARYDDFSRWPPPTETEAAFWSDAQLRHDRLTSFLKLHWSHTTGVFKRARFLLHLLFPNPKIIRLDYPPAHNWLLPFSYVRRLYRWFKQYFVSRFSLSNKRG